ncbi:MAG: Holliday junction branch migration protein RuvA [Deltaproteobacteria bacterium]|nr:Holliday junction branch migration protein RuvA [Deltaproteobacteria bacterium]
MIALLSGEVISTSGSAVTLDVNGVGYEVICSRGLLSQLSQGQKARIIIYTDIKQESIRLYGFEDELEKQVFLLLLQVKGIGARSSSDIISKLEKRELLRLVAAGDLTKLQAVKGIGKKTAERIMVELRDRVADYLLERKESQTINIEIERQVLPVEEAAQALQALGFSRRDAEKAIENASKGCDLSRLGSGEVVREALRYV